MNWAQLNENKWELKSNEMVVATIFNKPNGKFSLFIALPKTFKKLHSQAAETYQFDSFDDADKGFVDIMKKTVLPWANAVLALGIS